MEWSWFFSWEKWIICEKKLLEPKTMLKYWSRNCMRRKRWRASTLLKYVDCEKKFENFLNFWNKLRLFQCRELALKLDQSENTKAQLEEAFEQVINKAKRFRSERDSLKVELDKLKVKRMITGHEPWHEPGHWARAIIYRNLPKNPPWRSILKEGLEGWKSVIAHLSGRWQWAGAGRQASTHCHL